MSVQGVTPRKLSSTRTLQDAFTAISDLFDAVRFLPVVEFKTFEIIAALSTEPLHVSTRIKSVQFISANAWPANDPSTTVIPGGVHWYLGPNNDLVVTRIGGLTTGTKYRVRLKIEGER